MIESIKGSMIDKIAELSTEMWSRRLLGDSFLRFLSLSDFNFSNQVNYTDVQKKNQEEKIQS